IFTAYRTSRPTGIAPATWWIAGGEGALWGYYGWFHGDAPIMIFAVTYVTTSALMLIRYYTVARQPSPLSPWAALRPRTPRARPRDAPGLSPGGRARRRG